MPAGIPEIFLNNPVGFAILNVCTVHRNTENRFVFNGALREPFYPVSRGGNMKRKLYSLFLAAAVLFCALPAGGFAVFSDDGGHIESTVGEVLYSFDFESDLIAAGWSQIDADKDTNTWVTGTEKHRDSKLGFNGSCCAISESYDNFQGIFSADNWLFTPALTIPASGAKVSWYEQSQDGDFPDSYTVYVGETITTSLYDAATNPSGMKVLCAEHKAAHPWTQISAELSGAEYGGKTVYIAFRHKDEDNFYLEIDNFESTAAPHIHGTGADAIVFSPWDGGEGHNKLPDKPGNYYLTSDINITDYGGLVAHGEDQDHIAVTRICLENHQITYSTPSTGLAAITVPEYAEVDLYSCGTKETEGYFADDGAWHPLTDDPTKTAEQTLVGGIVTSHGNVPGVLVYEDGLFCMYGGNIAGISAEHYGGIDLFQGAAFHMYGGNIIGNSNVNYSGGVEMGNDTEFYMYGGNITKNRGGFGGGIYSSGRIYLDGGTISENDAEEGAGINLGAPGKLVFVSGTISGNTARDYGAGIYARGDINTKTGDFSHASVTMVGGTVTGNTAGTGAGFYYQVVNGCVAEGTPITLPDGSRIPVEDLQKNTPVRSFDHAAGGVTASPASIIYKHEGLTRDAYRLHFSGGTELTVAGEHAFFEKEANNYVILNSANARDYIGSFFYDIDLGIWRELERVTEAGEPQTVYSLYTSGTLNYSCAGMLACEAFGMPLCNPFELDENMTVIPEKKEKDIRDFGLMEFEEQDLLDRRAFDDYQLKYLKIAVGKGLTSFDMLQWGAANFGLATGILSTESGKAASSPAKAKKLLKSAAAEVPSFADCDGVTFGGSATITGNCTPGGDASDLMFYSFRCKVATGTFAPTTMKLGLANSAEYQITEDSDLSAEDLKFFFLDGTRTGEKLTVHDKNAYIVALRPLTNASPAEDKDANNGYIELSADSAYTYDEVTVSVHPNEYYLPKTVSYNDGEDHEITPEDGVYKFTMPAAGEEVVVSAEFEALNTFTVTDGTAKDAHGSVSFTKTRAAAGEPIGITVDPEEGYRLKSLEARYFDGEQDQTCEIMTVKGILFLMPAYDVTVTAEFEKIHSHNLVKVDGQAPTETASGWTAYYECKDIEDACHACFEDATGAVPIEDLETWKAPDGRGYIPPLVHSITPASGKDPTDAEAGYEPYYECKNCGKYYEDATGLVVIPDIDAWKSENGGGYLAPLHGTDDDHDHICDYCDRQVSECVDANKDHACDICGGQVSECIDENKDHACDICGGQVSECVDANKDHACDICGGQVSACIDENKDHACDICGGQVSEHKGVFVEGTAATPESAGFKSYYKCDCGRFFEDATCRVEITDLAAWKAPGGNGYLPKLENEPTSPETGDTSGITLWLTLPVLFSLCLGACLFLGKKRKKEQ